MMIATKTGWTMHYILWGVSWINLRMMLADEPGMRKKKKQVVKKVSGAEAAKMMGLL